MRHSLSSPTQDYHRRKIIAETRFDECATGARNFDAAHLTPLSGVPYRAQVAGNKAGVHRKPVLRIRSIAMAGSPCPRDAASRSLGPDSRRVYAPCANTLPASTLFCAQEIPAVGGIFPIHDT
jgi:hypothetical protein